MEEEFGRTSWFDLPVTHLSDAMSFYQGLFGWEYRQMEDSPEPQYVMIDAQGTLIGGLRKVSQRPSTVNSTVPVLYFTVKQLAAQVARARELGAEVVGTAVRLGRDRGSYQWIRDREGNLIGLWSRE